MVDKQRSRGQADWVLFHRHMTGHRVFFLVNELIRIKMTKDLMFQQKLGTAYPTLISSPYLVRKEWDF
jgi:hypothetical protein